MTRLEFLKLVVARARANGFEFRRWYTSRLGLPWISADAALCLLETQRRYYALIFSHEFAQTFWKPGTEIVIELPLKSFPVCSPDGTVRTVERKPHLRRSLRPDVWRYHLKNMALAEEPLRYLRKYMRVEEQLDPEPEVSGRAKKAKKSESKRAARKNAAPKPLPNDLPAFLKRPYPGSRN